MSTSMDDELLRLDAESVWHPYSALPPDLPSYPVVSANGSRLLLADGRELIDGMSSWWCAIHGYNHPRLNAAAQEQIAHMAHVMFGGLTHEPALALAQRLLKLAPKPLCRVFYCDSGSVAVEVALKMALQYWQARGEAQRQRFVSLRGAYHGDTFAAMSLCDPATGMHHLFPNILPKQLFAPRPACRFNESCNMEDIQAFADLLHRHQGEIAAVIMEPILQGAGGMWCYSPEYLSRVRDLCDEYGILLILDEIATGFGRTGKMFACEHAGIVPEIMCVGKALTGGYLTLAATLCTAEIQKTLCMGQPGAFMHGPTFMANPLACAVAATNLDLLVENNWHAQVRRIERGLQAGLEPCRALPNVADVRVLGAVGVVEMRKPVDLRRTVPAFVEDRVWIRPFGKLIYLMPPYIISDADLETLCAAIRKTASAGAA
ncbi:MAG: adenosylmethionine--8-amino-7-oxononanoate transaminase [Candidatus Eutrophobiaceae bacterium]